MALIRPSEPWATTAEAAAQRCGFAALSELELRNRLEAFCRARWPGARVCHEMVMGEGRCRADVVAIEERHIAAFEVKGAYDDTTRLLHQVGMFQLCVPEVWMVVAENHDGDAKLIRHLLPSVGLITCIGMDRSFGRGPKDISLEVVAEPVPRAPVPEMLARLMWATEVRAACASVDVSCTAKATRESAVKRMLEVVGPEQLMRACCAQLRSRDALWRADPPVRASRRAAGVESMVVRP